MERCESNYSSTSYGVIHRNCSTNNGRVTNCGTAGSRNCEVTWHQLWPSTNCGVTHQLWSYKCMSRCEPLIGRSFGWICLSISLCPCCIVQPMGKVGVKLIRTSLGSGGGRRQPNLLVLFAGQLIQYVRYTCYQL